MQNNKAARPEMYWDERKGVYRKRVKIDGRWTEVSGRDMDTVREKVYELRRKQKSGILINDNTVFGEYAVAWYKIKSAGLRPKSKAIYKTAFNRHIADVLGDMKLKEIKKLHIQALMSNLAYLSKSSQSKVLFTIKQVLNSAVENGLLEKNPADGIKAGGATAKKKTPLTGVERQILLEHVEGTEAELFVMLCLMAGLRREEALGLTWSSVYLDEVPYIEVTHTVTFDGNRPLHTTLLKTAAANRRIPLPPVLAEKLRNARHGATDGLVVASPAGGPMSLTVFRRMWDIVLERLDISEHPRENGSCGGRMAKRERQLRFNVAPHILRHTYITDLCARGIDIKKIQYLAGHEDVKMTLSVYAHVTENTPEELSCLLGYS